VTRRLLNVHQVAEILGLQVSTVYHLASQGRLPCVRLSARCLRFEEAAIDELIEALAKKDYVKVRI